MPTNTVGFLILVARVAESEREVANNQPDSKVTEEQGLARAFLTGFLWPLRFINKGLSYLWKALAWASHKPPLKQIGHGVRWFFRLRAVRFIGRLLGFGYLRESWHELKGVTWPNFRESMRLTSAVIIFSIIFGVLIAIVDFGLDKLFKEVLLK